ncbi:expressed unknown protein [Seminavis robusta]|uniref:PDZ domain-containing protein n=1 Tax=Seminavis robusta TaxID=568900 RepID=A0A9N8HI77_9STRA|nr:expressed unknown protein [Seminavis robusta]|eukprot:Sro485_g152370.1 n/a (307) ;mRNA; f:14534-15454
MTEASARYIDLTLLSGLEPAMSPEEQARVTEMLVSGDKNELAKAAHVLYDLGVLLKQGMLFSNRSEKAKSQLQASFQKEFKSSKNRPAFNDRDTRVSEEKKQNDFDRDIRSHALPLPVRMPRMVIVEAYDPDGTPEERKLLPGTKTTKPSLNFCDDPWDGTLGAAFTKLEVTKSSDTGGGIKKFFKPKKEVIPTTTSSSKTVDTTLKFSPGFDAIADRMDGGYSAKLTLHDEPRVLISSLHNDAAKVGLQKGDVVTHINGEEFLGNAQELNFIIKEHYANAGAGDKLELVVNAEQCVAKALQLRAM